MSSKLTSDVEFEVFNELGTSQRTSSQWYELGIAASNDGKFELAEEYFDRANAARRKKSTDGRKIVDINKIKEVNLWKMIKNSVGENIIESLPVDG